MDWAAWAPTLVTTVGVIFGAGSIFGRIKDQEKTIKSHHDRLEDHDDKIDKLGNRMTASEAWKEGYNAGRTR